MAACINAPLAHVQWKSKDGAHKIAGIEFKTSKGSHYKDKASDTSYGCNIGCEKCAGACSTHRSCQRVQCPDLCRLCHLAHVLNAQVSGP